MQQELPKVKLVSTLLLVLCWFTLVTMPLIQVYIWISPGNLGQVGSLNPLPFDPAALSTGQLIGGFSISMTSQLVILYGVWRLRALFLAYRRGELFEVSTTGHLKVFSISVLVYLLLQPVTEAALTALLTMGNPEGERMVSISFGSDDIYMLLLGAVLLVVAWVLNEGAKAARENRMII